MGWMGEKIAIVLSKAKVILVCDKILEKKVT